jgi:Icc-related predicted phosphoesterase
MDLKSQLTVAVFLLAVSSCDSQRTLEDRLAQKEAENTHLMEEMNLRDQYITQVTEAINEVQDNLRSISEKERTLRATKRDIEFKTGDQELQRNEILADISDIHEIIENSRRTISDLQMKVSKSKTRVASLEATVLKLTQTINQKELEILDLRNELKRLNILVSEKDEKLRTSEEMLSLASDSLRQQKENLEMERELTQRVYYAIGTEDQLLSSGVLKKTGGNFLGGKVLVINEHISLRNLSGANVSTCGQIPVTSHFENLVLITPHILNSYSIDKTQGIIIRDKYKFWQLSRIAVVLVED